MLGKNEGHVEGFGLALEVFEARGSADLRRLKRFVALIWLEG